MEKKRLSAPYRPAVRIVGWRNSPTLWHDSEALKFLEQWLASDRYDHAVMTGWKSLDLLASADRRAADFRKALLSGLDRGRKISVVIGGILSHEDLNSLLLEMRRMLANRSLREHFDRGRLRFARDSAQRPLHAKCWVFWRHDKVVDLIVGSFNLTTASFFRNIEAAARTPADEGAHIVKELHEVLAKGMICPKRFADVEKHLKPRRPASEIPAEKREMPYLEALEGKKGTVRVRAWAPRTADILEPKLSDYFVVLRDPSRGERVGYRIPDDLLAHLFGRDFLGTKETEMGFIQGPRSLIVPFPLPLAKEYRSRMAALSGEIAARCTPTSVGYVVRDASKDALQDRLERKFAANEQTKKKMMRTIEDRKFPDFLMQQIKTQIMALRDRYAQQIELRDAALTKKLMFRRRTILHLAKQAAGQMIERLDRERKVSFVPLEELLDFTEGISRTEIEAELAER